MLGFIRTPPQPRFFEQAPCPTPPYSLRISQSSTGNYAPKTTRLNAVSMNKFGNYQVADSTYAMQVDNAVDSHSEPIYQLSEAPNAPTKRKRRKSHPKKVTQCAHTEKPYYSKGMCFNCYHSVGRIKLASTCGHSDRKLYALGACKACYLENFRRRKLL